MLLHLGSLCRSYAQRCRSLRAPNAVNTDACMRCDAATIETYLQTLVN